MMKEGLLTIDQLEVSYGDFSGLRRVSMSADEGKIVGIVGESGSGKSTLIYSVLGILGKGGRVTAGSITYKGIDLLRLSEEELRRLRGVELSLIAQNPVESFHPVRKIRSELKELIKAHECMELREAEEEMIKSLEKFGLKDGRGILGRYAFELSGGMCQRTSIAMAMVLRPKILFADEPTSALDVTVQKQVVEELMKIREDYNTTIVMVSHNMGVISYMSDEIVVMYEGIVVEYGTRECVLKRAVHPYTKNLIRVIPRLNVSLPKGVPVSDGRRDSEGCPYARACPGRVKRCCEEMPYFVEAEKNHFVRCLNVR